jgi:hypothetical protein
MIKNCNRNISGIAILLGFLFILSCEKQQSVSGITGFLKGKISIGPLCPVETIPPDPACLPTAQTYKAYPVDIWTPDGKVKVAQLQPALDGSYVVELPQGDYLVNRDNVQNFISSSNLPVIVTITQKEYSILNISIDTGIR